MPFASNDGVRLYWEESGRGNPLLLIMGFGYPLDMWHRTRPVMARHFRTIAYDNRGVGSSDVPGVVYRMEQMAEDAVCVLDAAGVSRAHVFGMSMGGMIALELAIRHPERVMKLVLGSTACGGPNAAPPEPGAIDHLMKSGTQSAEDSMAAARPYIYDPQTPRERIEEDEQILARKYPSTNGHMGQLEAMLHWQSYDRLGEVRAPTLVLSGEDDRLIPSQNGRIIAGRIPGAKFVLIPQASHMFITDQPERTHIAILEFLNASG